MKRKPGTRKSVSKKRVTLDRKFKRLRLRHKLLFTLVGSVGVILVWRGVWSFFDTTPFLNQPVASLIIGIILVILSGFLFHIA